MTPLTPAADTPLQFEDRSTQRIAHSTCYMCACRCGIQVTLQDHPATPESPARSTVRFIQGLSLIHI